MILEDFSIVKGVDVFKNADDSGSAYSIELLNETTAITSRASADANQHIVAHEDVLYVAQGHNIFYSSDNGDTFTTSDPYSAQASWNVTGLVMEGEILYASLTDGTDSIVRQLDTDNIGGGWSNYTNVVTSRHIQGLFSVKNQGRIKDSTINSSFLESQIFNEAIKEYSNSMSKISFPISLESKAGDIYEFTSLSSLLDKLSEIGKKGYSIQRYKGLGEMNPEQLWETTLDPTLRVLKEVTIADIEDIDKDSKESNLFEDLMGDQVEPRKKIIEDNALYVSNLDI